MAGIATTALLRGQADEVVVVQVAEFDVDTQQLGRNFRALRQDDRVGLS